MNFTEPDIAKLAKQHYQLDAESKSLDGYDELNFLLKDKAGKKYIFKVATDDHQYDFLDAQVKIINHLANSNVSDKFQKYLLNTEGKELTTIVISGINYYLRILTF